MAEEETPKPESHPSDDAAAIEAAAELPEDVREWHKKFADQCNALAWELAENEERSLEDWDEMLHAAHTAAWHYERVGRRKNTALAHLLLAQVYALLEFGKPAMLYAESAASYILDDESERPQFEIAFVHAVLAHAGYVLGALRLHAEHYKKALETLEFLDGDEREIFMRSFAQIPEPS